MFEAVVGKVRAVHSRSGARSTKGFQMAAASATRQARQETKDPFASDTPRITSAWSSQHPVAMTSEGKALAEPLDQLLDGSGRTADTADALHWVALQPALVGRDACSQRGDRQECRS
ncbi:hypothetical protein CKO25_07115 [Thiocapsa imhoffii]|uniref:Uncharacterized protein n=1 Tax=Thiocapsa imhoffii TaxID=382777 RepID=A0A9X0WH06_9GAMM|nr:hypothetical protein [Thiocapsa imhoffii]